MRYAIFTDIHANLEALEAVLTKIDELAQQEPIDQIWFLGDLVGYGPNPNECITKLREHTDIIIAGNHDWAAIGKISLEDFSEAARISAEWTAQQLTEEHRTFLADLPQHLDIGDCTLVHGSPYGPLWEYLTSPDLAERSFQCFTSRYCFVGHTHVPVIFQQPDTIANAPTLPLSGGEPLSLPEDADDSSEEDEDETAHMVAVHPPAQTAKVAAQAESAYADPETGQTITEEEANVMIEAHTLITDQLHAVEAAISEEADVTPAEDAERPLEGSLQSPASDQQAQDEDTSQPRNEDASPSEDKDTTQPEDEDASQPGDEDTAHFEDEEDTAQLEGEDISSDPGFDFQEAFADDYMNDMNLSERIDQMALEAIILSTEDNLTDEEKLQMLYRLSQSMYRLSQSMTQVTNEMLSPPEGHWEAPEEYRAIINPGGVGQPRDGDPRAAFMIYDTERGFDFYRIPYDLEKTQEKIIKANLPQYLAIRLADGR